MNLVHTTQDGQELWLGDYYAASNHNLLKQKNIKAGNTNILYSPHSCKRPQYHLHQINADRPQENQRGRHTNVPNDATF